MIYQLFLLVMGLLTDTFGYNNALMIKDVLDHIAGDAEAVLIMLIIFSLFLLDVRKYPGLEPEATIVKVEYEGIKSMQINPKSIGGAIRVFISWFFLKLSPESMSKIQTKAAKPLTFIIVTLLIVVFLLGTLLSMWHYLPNGQTPVPAGLWSHFWNSMDGH